MLFGYYLLLNAFVVTVNWFKGWRYLNLTAFIFTFLVGFAWAAAPTVRSTSPPSKPSRSLSS